jgi:DNA-binding transcriptional LysR family regulator
MARKLDSLTRVRDLDLNDLRVFVRVVDRGGFAAAARELGVPTSTVSRTIARLEASTGTRLLQRTPRSVHATSEGRAIYASVSEALGTLERAARALEPATRGPKGVLRVTAPTDIGSSFLADVAVAFGERYPLVQIDLALTNRAVNLVDEGFDVAVRAATRLADSSLVAKKVGELEHALYASPRYVESRGAPSSPSELGDHRCIVFRAKDLAKTWRLYDDKETIEVLVRAHAWAATISATSARRCSPGAASRSCRASSARRTKKRAAWFACCQLSRPKGRALCALSVGRSRSRARDGVSRLCRSGFQREVGPPLTFAVIRRPRSALRPGQGALYPSRGAASS